MIIAYFKAIIDSNDAIPQQLYRLMIPTSSHGDYHCISLLLMAILI